MHEAFVAVFGSDGQLHYSSFLGGSADDSADDLAIGPDFAAFVVGYTNSPNFPTTPSAFDSIFSTSSEGFVTKLSTGLEYPVSLTLSPTSAVKTINTNYTLTATVHGDQGGLVPSAIVRFVIDGTAATTTNTCTSDVSGACSVSYTSAVADAQTITAWADMDADGLQDLAEPTSSADLRWLPVHSGILRGTVANDFTGAPIAGITVKIYADEIAGGGTFVTGPDGSFEAVLSPGLYWVQALGAPDFVDEAYPNDPCVPFCGIRSGRPVNVSVNGVTTIAFSVSPATNIRGIVTNAATNQSLPNVNVHIYHADGAIAINTKTDATGQYSVSLPASNYRAFTSGTAGFVDELWDDILCPVGCPLASGTLIVGPVGGVAIADFRLQPQGGGITGRVTDESGQPIAGITAIVFNSSGVGVASAVTSANGEYLTGDLPTGNYFVKTHNTLGFVDELFPNIACATGCVVTTGTGVPHTAGFTGGEADFMLAVGGRIRGTVTGQGNPLPNAPVHVYSGQTGALLFSAVTGGSGSYETPALPLGAYYARTGNTAGYANEGFENVDCALVCDPSTGTPIWVIPGAIATATFDLGPNTPVRESNFIIPELPNGTTPTGLMFFGLTAPGRTTVTASATGPALPSGYSLGDQPVFHTLQTTASFNVGAIVCFVYQGTNFDNLSAIKLLQHQGGAWNDITTSGSPGQHVCGITASLSQFVVVEQTGP
jgi:hypothetical protein